MALAGCGTASTADNSLPTGISSHHRHAGLWEPYDERLSRTVMRVREGVRVREVPSRYSPGTESNVPGEVLLLDLPEPRRRHEVDLVNVGARLGCGVGQIVHRHGSPDFAGDRE